MKLTPEEQEKFDKIVSIILDLSIERTRAGYRIIDDKEVKCFDGQKRIINDQTREFHKNDKKRLAIKHSG